MTYLFWTWERHVISFYIMHLDSLEVVLSHLEQNTLSLILRVVSGAWRHPVGRGRVMLGAWTHHSLPCSGKSPTTPLPWGGQNITMGRSTGEKKQRLPTGSGATIAVTYKLNDMLIPRPSSKKLSYCVSDKIHIFCMYHYHIPMSIISHYLNYLNSSVYGILQARILEGVAIPFSRGSSKPRAWTWVFCIAGRFFPIWATREAQSQL